MTIAAVVLAAGASRRLGRPKQEILLAGETLLHRTIRIASEAGLSPIIVVTRQEAERVPASTSSSIITVVNENAEEGVASSIRCGIELAGRAAAEGAVILACDQPAVDAGHLRALIDHPAIVTGSAYAGSIGVPAYFPAGHFPELMRLHGDKGARALLKTARAIEAEELKLDVDTEEDLRMAHILFGEHRAVR